MGAFVATHARSIDDVDKAILEARCDINKPRLIHAIFFKKFINYNKTVSIFRAALTEVTQELQERMHRWKQIEMLVKSPIVNNPGLTSLEILLRTGSRAHPYLGMTNFNSPNQPWKTSSCAPVSMLDNFLAGTGSVMSNSQDDIDDDGASSIYCQSAGKTTSSPS